MKKSTWLIVLLHVMYWGQPIIGFIINIKLAFSNDNWVWVFTLINTPVAMAAFYVAYFFLFPLISKKKIWLFTVYGLLTVFATLIVAILILYGLKHDAQEKWVIPALAVTYPTRVISSIFIACLLRGAINWYTDIRYKEQLEKKNLETSLALLKAQINPHFLFNTLNNIDVLIEKDPATASVYLKKLSDILRFTLYESPGETVNLLQEVNYIRQYIELQKIRTSNPDFVKFEVKGEMKYADIAPMLFIPFIENAFKHCTNKKISNAVAIEIASDGRTITFECSNAYEPGLMETQQKGGLGLELIKNRLELLYRDRYHLDINKTSERFTVTLKIYLNDN